MRLFDDYLQIIWDYLLGYLKDHLLESFFIWDYFLDHLDSLRQASLSRATKQLMRTPRGHLPPPYSGGRVWSIIPCVSRGDDRALLGRAQGVILNYMRLFVGLKEYLQIIWYYSNLFVGFSAIIWTAFISKWLGIICTSLKIIKNHIWGIIWWVMNDYLQVVWRLIVCNSIVLLHWSATIESLHCESNFVGHKKHAGGRPVVAGHAGCSPCSLITYRNPQPPSFAGPCPQQRIARYAVFMYTTQH